MARADSLLQGEFLPWIWTDYKSVQGAGDPGFTIDQTARIDQHTQRSDMKNTFLSKKLPYKVNYQELWSATQNQSK